MACGGDEKNPVGRGVVFTRIFSKMKEKGTLRFFKIDISRGLILPGFRIFGKKYPADL